MVGLRTGQLAERRGIQGRGTEGPDPPVFSATSAAIPLIPGWLACWVPGCLPGRPAACRDFMGWSGPGRTRLPSCHTGHQTTGQTG